MANGITADEHEDNREYSNHQLEEVNGQLVDQHQVAGVLVSTGICESNTYNDGYTLGNSNAVVQLIDPKNVHVIQARATAKPNQDVVESMRRSIQDEVPIQPSLVLKDAKTGGLYSGDSANRREAYIQEDALMPAIIQVVDNAKEVAEAESCKANEENGQGRSPQDKLYQAVKAVSILEERFHRPPKPRELADFTKTSQKFCNGFLRDYYAPKSKKSEEPEMDSKIPGLLEPILETIKKIKIPDGWECGELTNPIIASILKELHKFKKHDPNVSQITIEEIKAFMDKRNITMANMGNLLDVDPRTISRWLKAGSEISVSNMRRLRQVMSMDEAIIAALLDGGGTNV